MVGREQELSILKNALEGALGGKSSVVFITGAPGIGKTRLVDEFRALAASRGADIHSGATAADAAHPFLVITRALDALVDEALFHQESYTSFAKVFAVNHSGLLVAESSAVSETLDSDIFAGMLSAVQDFVKDSFETSEGQSAGLGRLEYGDLKILTEHGQQVFLTAVFSGAEHTDMGAELKHTLRAIEEEHGPALERWSGILEEIGPVAEKVQSLADARFLVRRDLEGVKLENERYRISTRVLELLSGAAADRSLVLLLEDLHWADESSLFVLDHLARNLADEGILLLCTARPGESPALDEAFSGMVEEGLVTTIELERLSGDSVRELIGSACAPNSFPEEFVSNLAEHCRGNPFFLLEILRHMVEDQSIIMDGGSYNLVREDITVPDSVEEVVHHRLNRLEPDALALVEFLSCAGKEFEADVTGSLRSVRDSAAALEALLDASI
ncbi:MAG: AAA family ATPase, partial [Thermoplasmata archaeon]|nr:AAA family ATPase [Thermoplasmata archaeon]